MKKLILFFTSAVFCLCFSGCTVFETDTEALMKPPVFTEEQEKLNAALTEVIGEDYVLKYPKTGEINSAFLFEDLDGDGTEEAMAFYSVLDEITRINVLKKDGEDWVSVYTAPGFYGEIKSADFINLDEKGKALVLKWGQEAGIYTYKSERLETVFHASCDGIDFADVDGNGFEEILVFCGTPMGKTNLNIVYGRNGKVFFTEDLSINAQYGDIFSQKAGKISEDESAYFIDSLVYEGVYLTEIITLENGEAERLFAADYVESEKEETTEEGEGVIIIVGGNYGKRGIFLRNTKAFCMDTNGDGIVEMPIEFREDYAQQATEEIFYVQYMQYDGTKSEPVWNGIINNESGYLFEVPESWNEKIRADFGSSSEEFIFVEKESGKVIFEIFAVSKSDYQDKYEDYIFAAEDETKNYYVKAYAEAESEFYISPESYNERFIFI